MTDSLSHTHAMNDQMEEIIRKIDSKRRYGHIEILKRKIANGTGINDVVQVSVGGFRSAYIHQYRFVPSVLKWLLEHGADINIKCSCGRTALMYAAYDNDDIAPTRLLLENGANVHLKDNEGRCALFLTMIRHSPRHHEHTRLLLRYGATVPKGRLEGYIDAVCHPVLFRLALIVMSIPRMLKTPYHPLRMLPVEIFMRLMNFLLLPEE